MWLPPVFRESGSFSSYGPVKVTWTNQPLGVESILYIEGGGSKALNEPIVRGVRKPLGTGIASAPNSFTLYSDVFLLQEEASLQLKSKILELAGEMAQRLRAWTALPKVLSSIHGSQSSIVGSNAQFWHKDVHADTALM